MSVIVSLRHFWSRWMESRNWKVWRSLPRPIDRIVLIQYVHSIRIRRKSISNYRRSLGIDATRTFRSSCLCSVTRRSDAIGDFPNPISSFTDRSEHSNRTFGGINAKLFRCRNRCCLWWSRIDCFTWEYRCSSNSRASFRTSVEFHQASNKWRTDQKARCVYKTTRKVTEGLSKSMTRLNIVPKTPMRLLDHVEFEQYRYLCVNRNKKDTDVGNKLFSKKTNVICFSEFHELAGFFSLSAVHCCPLMPNASNQ